ncbi:hypothetical protein ABEB36_002662 [Hypothenemus hampei]|uniref:Aminopeptidase n=1 Tax=Hypothenemus hampei TaxID=57062 RepID=A0ABD1F768_HYPHA
MMKETHTPYSSRTEFLTDDQTNDGLRFSRNGGCFVTTKKAISFVVIALASLCIVIILMYYYGPKTKLQMFKKEINDIEELLNETINEEILKEDLRLPKHVHPILYKLNLYPLLDEPNKDNFTFTGDVEILVNCTSATNKIVLNWDEELTINESDIKVSAFIKDHNNETKSHNITRREVSEDSLNSNDGPENIDVTTEEVTTEIQTNTEPIPELKVATFSKMKNLEIYEVVKDAANFKLVIILKNRLYKGEAYIVNIKFSGNITNNLVGIYKTSYTDLAGNVKWLVTTQLASVYARTVFPCFDEPSFKARFELSIARRTNMTTISNMPLKEVEPINETGWVWDHFETTPPMSTYLLAFTICDYGSVAANSSTATVFQVWAPKDDLPKAQYALEFVQEILPFFEQYFGIKYPLPKLDLVAIPSFSMDAMENWGVIHFRKSTLLLDPSSKSIKAKSLIFAKIAHELAHQWFGNLVTMEWWSDLWLNEGFGTFMAEVTLSRLRPRWHMYSSLQLRNAYTTLYYDSLKSTQSIESQVNSNAQIEQIYDTYIVTKKGSSILKMLNFTLTKDIFQKGLHNYLKKFSFKSTNQDDLWGLFTKKAHNQSILPENVTVKALMNSWTTQSGYPCISFIRDYAASTAKINQTKMTEDSNITDSNELWYVPITYVTQEERKVKTIWLEHIAETVLNLSDTSNDSWILLNIEETGFFRVNYDIHNWNLLTKQLAKNPNKIPVSNRGHLIDDAFQLANTGHINYTIAFNLVKYLTNVEINYVPWYAALRNMEELRVIISNYEYSGLYENFILKLVRPMFDELGTDEKSDDTQNEKLLRLLIVTSACQLRYSKCSQWARSSYDRWMKSDNPNSNNIIPVDYKYIVQCSAIKSGGPEEWDFLWNRTLSPSISPADLETAYLSLGCTYDPWLINRYLEYSLDGNMTLENVQNVWVSINHPVGVKTGFQFLRLNWERIYDTYEDIFPIFSTIFHDFVSQLSTEVDLEDLTTFYKLHQNDLKSVATILQSSVDQMKVRIKWKKKHLSSVVNWLKENSF